MIGPQSNRFDPRGPAIWRSGLRGNLNQEPKLGPTQPWCGISQKWPDLLQSSLSRLGCYATEQNPERITPARTSGSTSRNSIGSNVCRGNHGHQPGQEVPFLSTDVQTSEQLWEGAEVRWAAATYSKLVVQWHDGCTHKPPRVCPDAGPRQE